MKFVFLGLIYFFICSVTLAGVPLAMKLEGLSQGAESISVSSPHESVIKLLGRSTLSLGCLDSKINLCTRPVDYSHLKANLPIVLEACQSDKKLPKCDDLNLKLSFLSSDLLKIGLRL